MKLLVTGATGFLGSRVVRLAIDRGHDIRAMARAESATKGLGLHINQICVADLASPESLDHAVENINAIVHCAAVTSETAVRREDYFQINVEGTRRLIETARKAGIRRWIQISSVSAHEAMTSLYGKTKFEADKIVRASGLDWTILQPSIIYGPGERGIVARTIRTMRRLPVLPIIGSGGELIRPIHVDDVARAALDCLESPQTIGKTYMLGGADEVTLKEFLKRLGAAAGVHRPAFHLPIGLALTTAFVLEFLTKRPPLTVDNVLGVKHVRRVDIAPAEKDFAFKARGLDEGLRFLHKTK
jgi:nucleoside-diphosphate-sugar epimerase